MFEIELRGMTILEICQQHPEQVAEAIERHIKESASSTDVQQLKQAIALLDECFTNGMNSNGALVAWFHDNFQSIHQTILEAQQACI
jgi:hypothetical protein